MADYLQLLGWTGRQNRREEKLGRIPNAMKPLFERAGLSAEIWGDDVRHFGKWHAAGAGKPASLKRQAERVRRNRWLTTAISQQVFT